MLRNFLKQSLSEGQLSCLVSIYRDYNYWSPKRLFATAGTWVPEASVVWPGLQLRNREDIRSFQKGFRTRAHGEQISKPGFER